MTISLNQANFLEKAIRSVITQDYPELEYILVDAGSSDGSRDIIERYRSRITHLILEPDAGPADGLNKGFSLATGELLGFLNSDDILLRGALQIVCKEFTRQPRVDVVAGTGFVIDEGGRIMREIFPTQFAPRRYARGAVTVFQQGTFFRRRAFIAAGGFNTGNATCWDGELFLDMALAGCKFKLLHERLAAFRVHEESISGSGNRNAQYLADSERLFRKVFHRDRARQDRLLDCALRVVKWIGNADKYVMRALRRRMVVSERVDVE